MRRMYTRAAEQQNQMKNLLKREIEWRAGRVFAVIFFFASFLSTFKDVNEEEKVERDGC